MPRRRPSTIDRLPPELRARISAARGNGATIGEILADLHARGARVSRSAVGRYTQRLDAASELGLAQELLALRGDIDDATNLTRTRIDGVFNELAKLRGAIEALAAAIREHRRSGVATT